MELSFDEAWKKLRRLANYVPAHLRSSDGDRQYQFFEVAVTLVLSTRFHVLPWKVTPVANDGGFDFWSELTFIDDSVLLDRARIVVGGQCKVPDKASITVHREREVYDRFIGDIGRTDAEILIACLAANVTPEARARARDSLKKAVKRPVEVITLSELRRLFRRHETALRPLMQKYYDDPEEVEAILAVITAAEADDNTQITVSVKSGSEVNCGEAFEVWVTVDGPPSVIQECRLSYRGAADDNGLRLLNHASAESHPLGTWAPYPQPPVVPLRFITFRPGTVDLGSVEVRDGDTCLASCTLGMVAANDTFIPSFFDGTEEIRHVLNEIARIHRESRAGKPRFIAVIGRGGNGKSRICAEAALQAEKAGAIPLSLPHSRHLEAPYLILADLVDKLIPPAGRLPYDAEGILQYVRTYNAELADTVAGTVRFLETQAIGPVDDADKGRSEALLSPAACARLISFLVGLRAQAAPLFIHLSNMHWGASEALTILDNALRLLTDSSDASQVPVTIVFEGRDKERLNAQSSEGSAPTSAVFEEFVAQIGAFALRVSPLTRQATAAFLDHLFEDRQASAGLPSDGQLDRRENELKAHLAKRAGGNPMHVIEVLRLLKAQGQVHVNHLSNRLLATGRLDLASPVPETVTDTVIARYRYLEEVDPGLAKLLSALAVHKDRCSKAILHQLRERFAPDARNEDLRKTEFVSVGDGCEFLHELYYEILHQRLPLATEELVDALDVYINDDDLQHWGRGAVSGVELGRLLQMHPRRRAEARSVLHKAVDTARRQNLSVVQRDALELLMAAEPVMAVGEVTDERVQDFVGQVRIRVGFAETNLWHGDRTKSVDVLQRLCERFDRVPRGNLPLGFELFERQHVETLVSYGNACLNQFRAYHAIEALQKALDHLAPWCDSHERGEPGFAAWIELKQRALNRLGVAYRIEGDPEQARDCLNAVFKEYTYGVTRDKFIFHLDFARAAGLADPVEGAALLRRTLTIDDDDESPDKQECLTDNSQISVSLVCHTRGLGSGSDQPLELDEMAQRAMASHSRARRAALVLETCGAALVAGAVAAVEDRWEQALRWFEECRDESFRNNHLELLWKAHVDAAQAALMVTGRQERAQEHLQLATTLIVDQDLGPRTQRQRRTRFCVCGLALAQLERVAGRLGDDLTAHRLRLMLDGTPLETWREYALGRTEFICVGETDLMLL